MRPPASKQDFILLLALALSGAAALGYELLWTRLFALSLGGEVLGILGVLTGFFGGMVLGAYLLSKHASQTTRPLRFFVYLELITAIYGAISPWLIYGLSDLLPQWLGPVAGDNDSLLALSLTILIAGIVLLPATFCIGANFAYLVEARRRVFTGQGRPKNLGRIYAANTLGATLGVFSAVYWVMPNLGLAWSGTFYALIGICAVGLALLWQKTLKGKQIAKVIQPPKAKSERSLFVYLLLFGTGLASIGLEIVVVHLLKQVLQNTVFTFANLLAVYLLGTALGAWLYQRYAQKIQKRTTAILFTALLSSILILLLVIGKTDHLLALLSPDGTYFVGHVFAEIGLAFLLFILPTIFMGGLFSHLLSWLSPPQVGRAYAINTLGSTLAPFLFGLVIIPIGGPYAGFLSVTILYLLLMFSCVVQLKWSWGWLMPGIAVFLLVALTGPTSTDLIEIKPHLTELERQDGLMGTVLVLDEPKREGPYGLPMRILQINNHFRMGGGVSFLERRMGNMPLLLANRPENALFLGVGTGTTLGVIKEYPLKKIDAVEIVPEIKSLLPWFKEHNQDVLNDRRLRFHTADARRFVVASREQYDIIIADLFHPARDGAGLLYTKEHFSHLKNHLSERGLVAQWLPLHQFDVESLKMVIRTFLSEFPNTHAFLGGYNAQLPVILLIGGPAAFTIDPLRIQQTISNNYGIQMAFENGQDLLGSYFMGPETLAAFAGPGQLNRDINPRILFEAPKGIYRSELEKAQENIGLLLQLREPMPAAFLQKGPGQEVFLQNVQKNWVAVGHFAEGNRFAVAGNMRQAYQKYMAAYQANPDFSPARGKLFQALLEGKLAAETLRAILIPRDQERMNTLLNR